MRNPAESQDEYEDEEGRIWPVVKLTAYDRSRLKLRDLEAKRDAIKAKSELTADDQRRLAMLAPLIEKAQERFKREGQRAVDDVYRKRRTIDEWRAGEGREAWNATRRKVRDHPNADLSGMTAEQKLQHERDRRSDANWIKRQRDKGVDEAVITADYIKRIEERERRRTDEEDMNRRRIV